MSTLLLTSRLVLTGLFTFIVLQNPIPKGKREVLDQKHVADEPIPMDLGDEDDKPAPALKVGTHCTCSVLLLSLQSSHLHGHFR